MTLSELEISDLTIVDISPLGEALFTCFLLEHNLPVAVADHAGHLFRKMFPDTIITKNYASARTKTGAIIGEMSTIVKSEISSSLRVMPFSISTTLNELSVLMNFCILDRLLDLSFAISMCFLVSTCLLQSSRPP
jgi:hypothetical protein